MSATVITPGETELQDPEAAIVRVFDWTDWLGEDALIDAADVTITVTSGANTTPLTIDHVAVLTVAFVDGDVAVAIGKGVSFRAQGGTVGTTYTVTCHIETDEAVVQEDDRSFKIKIKER